MSQLVAFFAIKDVRADGIRITKIPLLRGRREVLVYTTISCAVGVLVPFVSSDDVEFMSLVEMVSYARFLAGS